MKKVSDKEYFRGFLLAFHEEDPKALSYVVTILARRLGLDSGAVTITQEEFSAMDGYKVAFLGDHKLGTLTIMVPTEGAHMIPGEADADN